MWRNRVDRAKCSSAIKKSIALEHFIPDRVAYLRDRVIDRAGFLTDPAFVRSFSLRIIFVVRCTI